MNKLFWILLCTICITSCNSQHKQLLENDFFTITLDIQGYITDITGKVNQGELGMNTMP